MMYDLMYVMYFSITALKLVENLFYLEFTSYRKFSKVFTKLESICKN